MWANGTHEPSECNRYGYNAGMETQNRNEEPAMSKKRLLVVDDEIAIAELIASIFTAEGMEVATFNDPLAALASFGQSEYDLAIIDIMMPAMDGYELCRGIREHSDMPVVFLSAKDEESDIVVGFTLGADDYVTKPFKPRELVARVKAHLRRDAARRASASPEEGILSAQGLEVDTRSHEASMHDVPLQLTPKEFAILAHLMENKGKPVPSKELYEAAWGERANASSANTVMVHIRHLRQKLAEVDSSKEIIQTAWGVGYRIAADAARGDDAQG